MARRFAYPFGLKRDGVKEVKEVSASLEVKDDTLAGDTIAELMSITSEAEGR